MGSLIRDCKRRHVGDSTVEKHEDFNQAPVMVRVDNLGMIFMASNITTTSCTKHVDIKYMYVTEYVKVKSAAIVSSWFLTNRGSDER